MRVIAGAAKGHKLVSPQGLDVRPTLDRVKESLFSILYSRLNGACVLDLFSGSGALGIEALSRGARRCVFVDCSDASLRCTTENLKKTRLDGQAVTVKSTADAFLEGNTEVFDIVFLDPPYGKALEDKVFTLLGNSIGDNGVVVLETESPSKDYEGYKKIKSVRYGRVYITLYKKGADI